jgi:hypothetical protein
MAGKNAAYVAEYEETFAEKRSPNVFELKLQ